MLSHVGQDEGLDGPSFDEAMRRRMRRYSAKNSRQHLALEFSEPRLWRLDQPDLTARFWQNTVKIMMQLLRVLPIPKSLKVCEPREFTRCESEPRGQLFDGFDRRKIPTRCGPDRLHMPRTGHPLVYGDFVSVLRPSASESWITTKKLNYFAPPGSRSC